jgi:hypothetical protein
MATSLMREAFGDAGLGSAHHPVILDYIKFVQTSKKKPGFEAENTISYFNSLLSNSNLKSAEYFSEIMILSNNIVSLEDPNVGTTSLKVIVNYVLTILKAKSIEKVRAVLDSRVFLKCINFLQSEDVHLRETILELIEEATKSFNRDHLYLFEKYDVNGKFDDIADTKLKTADEIQKNFGLVSHLALTSEDKMDKSNYINCVRNYFAINSKICEKYIRQISLGVSLPSFFVSMATMLKTNTEILRNKVHCLEVIFNITNAPYSLISHLGHSSIDSFSTLGKFFVVMRSGKKNKLNEYLLPYAVKIFRNLIIDGRRDVLKLMENAVGLRTLLREQNLVIPRRLNLGGLTEMIQQVDVYFKNYSKDMIKESNMLTVGRYTGSQSKVRTEKLIQFESLLKQCCVKIICWLTYESSRTNDYSISILQDIIFRFIENIKFYFESLVPYYQTNETITSCMLSITNFLETLVNLGFDYLIMDTVLTTRGVANIEWIMLQVYNIYNYHQALGLHEKPEEGEKLLEYRINKIDDLEERSKELIKFIQNSGCLVKYTNCRIAQSGHSLLKILMALLEKNDESYNSLFEATHLVYFISSLMQKQYSLLQMFIRTKTESIHVIGRYVEESNLRIRIFESLLKCSSEVIKQELLESQMVHRIINTLLASKTELDVSFYRSNYKFLVFRNFLPFRAEALALISLIFWNKTGNERIYNELINEIIKANSLRSEVENMRQKKNRLLKMSAVAFFSRLIHSGDRHINYLMREQGVIDALMREFEEDKDMIPLFRDTYLIAQNMESVF